MLFRLDSPFSLFRRARRKTLRLFALSRIVIRIVNSLLAAPICTSLGSLPEKSVRGRVWQLAYAVAEKSRLLNFFLIFLLRGRCWIWIIHPDSEAHRRFPILSIPLLGASTLKFHVNRFALYPRHITWFRRLYWWI